MLLDEISEVPPRVQAKLLRALEEEEFQRVGGNDTVAIRARVLATSNRCLDEEVAAGRFRQDLYFRLNVLQIVIPPLRERREDIDPLAESFRRTFHTESPRPLLGFTESLVRWMRDYRWPGNVRQLRNLVRRLCLVHNGVWATCDDLPPLPNSDHGTSQRPDALGLCDMTLRDAEQLLIQHALRRFRGNRTAAARHLGISPRTLHNHLRRNPTLDAA